jgi:hypothetical protein
MNALSTVFPDTQTIAQLVGSAVSKRPLNQQQARVFEWALVQIALDGAGPVTDIQQYYQTALQSGADWHSALSAAILQTPRKWGVTIQYTMSNLSGLVDEYRESDVAVFQFADSIITRHSTEVPPLTGFVPMSAPLDPRPTRLFELADQLDVAGEAIELSKVFQDRMLHILKRGYRVSFEGALAALFCDLGVEPELVHRVLSVATLVSVIFRPTRTEI